MFDVSSLITNHLWLGLSLFMIIIIFVNRTSIFQGAVLGEMPSFVGKGLLIILFSIIGILGTYWSINIGIGTINTRAVGVIVGGLIGGQKVGFITGAIVGIHRFFFMDNFSMEESAMITLLQGWLAGFFSATMKEQKKMWLYAFKVGFSLEALHMFLLLVFAAPYERAVALVEVIALPMLITNSIGIAAFIGILEDNYERNENLKAATTKTALNIANLTLPILKNGFNNQSAQEIAISIGNTLNNFNCVAILTNKQVMATFFEFEDKNDKLTEYLEQFVANGLVDLDENKNKIPLTVSEAINSGDSQGRGDFFKKKKEISPFTAKIVTPIFNGDKQVASLFLGKLKGSVSDSDAELAKGLSNLISAQIEIDNVKEQAKLLVKAELKALQYQINPHFLFNALNTISYHCRKQPETAKKLLTYLADYYRHSLVDSNALIPLKQELQHISAYINIEMARFEERLKVIYIMDEECDFALPPLIIQPLVENAVKHGIQPKAEGGKITIEITKHDNHFKLSVKDNGLGIDDSRLEQILRFDTTIKSIGLSNVHKRLITMYGLDYGLNIESHKDIGTTVSFKIPII